MTTTQQTFDHIERWTTPPSYFGETWFDHYSSGVGQHRDSDCLERSNFLSMTHAMEAIPESDNWGHDDPPWQVVTENHFLVGWVEWISIHQDAAEHLEKANELAGNVEDYPILDEDLYSEIESDEANETWQNCYNDSERIEYIRKYRNQFEFHNLEDMLGCVRGNYFTGYASELID